MLDPRLTPLVPFYGSAELFTCGLIRKGAPIAAKGWAVNGFSVLRFLDQACPSKPQQYHITKVPESAPTSPLQLFISRSELSVAEGIALTGFTGSFPTARVPKFAPIESPGVWTGPEFVGREEHRARACLPTQEAFWLLECWRTGSELEDELGPDGIDWFYRRVNELTAVNLNTHRERLGNFLIVMPDFRYRMRTWWPRSTKLGVEVRTRAGGPTSFGIMIRSERDGALLSSEYQAVAAGFHVFDVPEEVDHRSIELYDQATGIIIDRDAGVPMRSIAFTSSIASQSFALTFEFTDGTPPVRAKGMWGSIQRTEVGDHPRWEDKLVEARERARREQLRESKQVIVFRGSASERVQAVDTLRNILQTRLVDYVKIWDPYFGPRDAAEFLPYVFDPSTPIRVLTSVEPQPSERAQPPEPPWREFARLLRKQIARHAPKRYRAGLQGEPQVPVRTVKKARLAKLLDTLRRPQGRHIFTQLECRVGGEMFHDRFIITRDRCWQLGCSFNQLGSVMSTIVEFPHPALIEREFDRAWERIKESL